MNQRALSLIAGLVTIALCAAITLCVIFLSVRCAKRVRAIGKRYEHRLTNELMQSSIVLPWISTDEEWTAEIPDDQVEVTLDRLTNVTIQSSEDMVAWTDRVTVRTDPVQWIWLADVVMGADRQTTTNDARFYRARW